MSNPSSWKDIVGSSDDDGRSQGEEFPLKPAVLSPQRSTGMRLTSGDVRIGLDAKIMGLVPMVARGRSDLAVVYLVAHLWTEKSPERRMCRRVGVALLAPGIVSRGVSHSVGKRIDCSSASDASSWGIQPDREDSTRSEGVESSRSGVTPHRSQVSSWHLPPTTSLPAFKRAQTLQHCTRFSNNALVVEALHCLLSGAMPR